MKNWIKEHFDTLAIVGAIVTATWTIKSDMRAIDIRLVDQIRSVDVRLTEQIHELDKRLTGIETIMLMQGAPVKALAAAEKIKE